MPCPGRVAAIVAVAGSHANAAFPHDPESDPEDEVCVWRIGLACANAGKRMVLAV